MADAAATQTKNRKHAFDSPILIGVAEKWMCSNELEKPQLVLRPNKLLDMKK